MYSMTYLLTVYVGNINQSLMVLRNCIEILRENQKQAANKVCLSLLPSYYRQVG